MTSDELSEFVRQALNRGLSRPGIRATLLAAGWSEAQVSSALDAFADLDFPVAVPRPRPSLSAREAFEYVILFGTLYFSAFALGQLLFQFINLAFPDPLWPEARFRAITDAIRWSISALAVTAPVFLFAVWSNAQKMARSPVKRTSPVRRWLTYITLAVAASLLIGDSTSLIYNLLGGEMTTRFLLKAAIIAAIAGTAFIYYLSDLRRAETELGT